MQSDTGTKEEDSADHRLSVVLYPNRLAGLGNARQLFGEQLPKLLDELNELLAA